MVFNKRNVAAFLFSKYLLASGRVQQISKRAASGEFLLSVYFHDPSKELFEGCLKWFLRNGYQFISTADVLQLAAGQPNMPAKTVVLTVDDGWRGNKDNIAAVAEKYHIPVTIFASTQPIETGERYWWSYVAAAGAKGIPTPTVPELKKIPNKERCRLVEDLKRQLPPKRDALTRDELKTVAKGEFVHIGSHTVSHPILTMCEDDESEREIRESKQILEGWLGKEVEHFAYPNGLYGEREINFLKESGYKTAYTTIPEYLTPEKLQNLFTLPRFDVLEEVSFTENICRMTGVWFSRRKK